MGKYLQRSTGKTTCAAEVAAVSEPVKIEPDLTRLSLQTMKSWVRKSEVILKGCKCTSRANGGSFGKDCHRTFRRRIFITPSAEHAATMS